MGRVSPKTTIVASDPRAAKDIQAALCREGLHVSVANQVRDLGVSFSDHRKRRKGIGAKRLINACIRLSRIGGWSAKIAQARRLVKSSPLPLGLWGQEASGFTMSDIGLLRSKIASASGISSPQRCVATAIALAFDDEPGVLIIQRLFKSFWVWSRAIPRNELRIAWKKAYERCGGSCLICPKMSLATGPLSVLIASLGIYGWRPFSLEVWISPDDLKVEISPDGDRLALTRMICHDVRKACWTIASTGHAG